MANISHFIEMFFCLIRYSLRTIETPHSKIPFSTSENHMVPLKNLINQFVSRDTYQFQSNDNFLKNIKIISFM